MVRAIALFLCVALLSISMITGCLLDSEREVDPGKGKVVVATDKESYGPGEEVKINIDFLNEGRNDLKLLSLDHNYEISQIVDSSERGIIGRGICIHLTGPVVIAPHDKRILSKSQWDQTNHQHEQVPPGTYKVKVEMDYRGEPTLSHTYRGETIFTIESSSSGR